MLMLICSLKNFNTQIYALDYSFWWISFLGCLNVEEENWAPHILVPFMTHCKSEGCTLSHGCLWCHSCDRQIIKEGGILSPSSVLMYLSGWRARRSPAVTTPRRFDLRTNLARFVLDEASGPFQPMNGVVYSPVYPHAITNVVFLW